MPGPRLQATPGSAPKRGGRGSHRRNQHVPRHVLEEHRIARTAAAGAAGAVVLGAAFGLTSGSLGIGGSGNDGGTAALTTRTSVDEALAERAASAPSRGLARAATVPEGSTILARAQAPQATPTAPSGPPAAPLPPVPEDCEEYSGNRQIGCSLLSEFGFDLSEMPALDTLWNRESGWNEKAYNSSSGAQGIPQALPGSKMASEGDDWETNPATQIRWGLRYIKERYGSPSAALAHSDANGWY